MRFRIAGTSVTFDFHPRALFIAGFTGRDRVTVDKHIEEMARYGVAPPTTVPAFYQVDPELLTTGPSITVASKETSGEVEPVLLCVEDGWYLTVGSDHTARDIERVNIERSKSACSKVIAREVWPYQQIADEIDDLAIRSWVWVGGQGIPYQDGRLADLLPVPEIVRLLEENTRTEVRNVIIFLGTVPLIPGEFIMGDRYDMEISRPGGETLTCSYEVLVNGGGSGCDAHGC